MNFHVFPVAKSDTKTNDSPVSGTSVTGSVLVAVRVKARTVNHLYSFVNTTCLSS